MRGWAKKKKKKKKKKKEKEKTGKTPRKMINTALFRQEHTNSQKGKIKGKEIIKQGTIKEESNQTSKGTHK